MVEVFAKSVHRQTSFELLQLIGRHISESDAIQCFEDRTIVEHLRHFQLNSVGRFRLNFKTIRFGHCLFAGN